ncbi:2-keto-3-deoxygluconate permease [Facklamia sp. P13069]|uniref:2-keto-3-deoxygluconate permease n=1 Tax=Facklamia sp. P13069 TaxID=3421954 RepID=UPI003D179606
MYFHTFWPDLSYIGRMTEAILSKNSIAFILAAITFCLGTMINTKSLMKVIQREGGLSLVKANYQSLLGGLILKVFGDEGFLGISLLALILAVCSANLTIFLPLVTDYAQEENKIGFNFVVFFRIPTFPLIVYSLGKADSSGFN